MVGSRLGETLGIQSNNIYCVPVDANAFVIALRFYKGDWSQSCIKSGFQTSLPHLLSAQEGGPHMGLASFETPRRDLLLSLMSVAGVKNRGPPVRIKS